MSSAWAVGGMDAVAKLQYLSLVNKVCTELDNHIGVSDKTLAEFVIDLAQRFPALPAFRSALEENGAEFPAPFAASLLTLVTKMTPKPKAKPTEGAHAAAAGSGEKFSGLAIGNDSVERRKALEREALGGAAVLNPEQTDAVYMVADGTGGHVFAATYDEHRANVEKWFAIRRARGEL